MTDKTSGKLGKNRRDSQERDIFERWYSRASVGSRLLYWEGKARAASRSRGVRVPEGALTQSSDGSSVGGVSG